MSKIDASTAKMRGTRHLTIVIKIGSSSIVDETTHQPILSILSLIVETAIKLRRDGHRVVIVSSGAIAVGLQRMNMPKKPKHLPQVQVCVHLLSCGSASLFMYFAAHFISSLLVDVLLHIESLLTIPACSL